MIELASAAIAYKSDRWAGNNRKWLGYSGIALALLFPCVPVMAALNAWGLLFIPFALLCALAIRKWDVWGEIWPNGGTDAREWDDQWFSNLMDKLYGKKRITLANEDLNRWRVFAWGLRYAIYGFPIALMYGFVNYMQSDYLNIITPFILVPVAGLVRGLMYWRGHNEFDNSWAEKWGGAIAMLIMVASV